MEETTQRNWYETLVGESLVLGLLARAFYTYADRAWLQSLADEDVFRDVPFASGQTDMQAGLALLQAWSDENRGGMSDEAFEDLRADYTRLFGGPGPVLSPPWESVYFNEERLTFQEQTLQVREWYARFGLQAEKIHNEPDDHIGLELSFLSYLARLAASAYEHGDMDEWGRLLAAQRSFASEHVLRWAPIWCDQICEQAQTTFFRGMALMVKGALAELGTILGQEPPENTT